MGTREQKTEQALQSLGFTTVTSCGAVDCSREGDTPPAQAATDNYR